MKSRSKPKVLERYIPQKALAKSLQPAEDLLRIRTQFFEAPAVQTPRERVSLPKITQTR